MAGKKPKRIKVEKDGRTALWDAAFRGDLAEVRRHLDAGVDVNWGDDEGLTPLYIAAYYGHLETVELLLEHGADPNLVSRDGMGPLYGAAQQASGRDPADRRLAVAELLLRHGADPDHPNRWGTSPRRWAEIRGFLGRFDAVVRQGNIAPGKTRKAEPPPRRAKKSDWWKREHNRLWDELVPPSGQAATLQGEVIRICGKLTREAYTNGNINWSPMCTRLWRFVAKTLDDPATFTDEERAAIKEAVKTIIRDRRWPDTSGDGSPYYLVGEKAVAWVLAHPEPIPHTADPEVWM